MAVRKTEVLPFLELKGAQNWLLLPTGPATVQTKGEVPMREWQSQFHVRWYCRYHIVIVPKYPRKSMYKALRREVGEVLRELCRRCDIELVEGHVMPDHVHMCLSIPPKHSSQCIDERLNGQSDLGLEAA